MNWIKASKWEDLRSIGNSRLVQLSVVFPFIGYLILFNDDVANFLNMRGLEAHQSSNGWIDSVWTQKIYFLYFGLMCLGVGSTLYQIWCPFIVKKHGDWSDYVSKDGETLSYEYLSKLGNLTGVYYNRAVMDDDMASSAGSEVMMAWYRLQSRDAVKARWCVTYLFRMGFVLLAVPSLLSAYKIAAILLKRLSS